MITPTITQLFTAIIAASTPIRQNFGRPVNFETKPDGTPVTPIDIQVNRSLMEWVKQYNDVGFIGEEGNGETNKPCILLADSLDGTGVYMRGMATCTVIVTLMKMSDRVGKPIMMVMYNPNTGELWYAEDQKGAYKILIDGPKRELFPLTIHLAKERKITTAICAWPKASHNLEAISKKIGDDPRFSDQQMGAVGIGGGLIAQGTLDATAFGLGSAREAAGMSLLVREAGRTRKDDGVTIDLNGNPINDFSLGMWKDNEDFLLPHGAIVAANQAIADTLLSFIKENQ